MCNCCMHIDTNIIVVFYNFKTQILSLSLSFHITIKAFPENINWKVWNRPYSNSLTFSLARVLKKTETV